MLGIKMGNKYIPETSVLGLADPSRVDQHEWPGQPARR
jgi:hypothetical protein